MRKNRIKFSILILTIIVLSSFILSSCALSKVKKKTIEGIERMINEYDDVTFETANTETTTVKDPVITDVQEITASGKNVYDASAKSSLLNVPSRLSFKGNVNITNCKTNELSNEGKVVLINFNEDEVDKYIDALSSSKADNSKMRTYEIGVYYAECCVIKNCIVFESPFMTKTGTVNMLESTKKSISGIVSDYRPSISGNFKIVKTTIESAPRYSVGKESLTAEIKLENLDTKNYKYQLVIVCDVKVVNIFKVTSKLSNSSGSGITEEKKAEYIGSQIIQTGNSSEYWFRATN